MPTRQCLQANIDEYDRLLGINPWLRRDNFVDRMHKLLWIEEAAQVKNFRKYDLAHVKLHPIQNGDGLWHRLDVPGLAERRPSVLKGDYVFVWVARGPRPWPSPRPVPCPSPRPV